MALQTTYSEEMARFFEGMIPDMRTPGEDRSLVVSNPAGIGFGKAVGLVAANLAGSWNPDKRIAPITAGAVFAGVTVADITQISANGDLYPQFSTARVRTEGPVVVVASEAVASGDLAGIDDTGAFIVAADAATAIGRYEVDAEADGLTIVNLKGAEGTAWEAAPAP